MSFWDESQLHVTRFMEYLPHVEIKGHATDTLLAFYGAVSRFFSKNHTQQTNSLRRQHQQQLIERRPANDRGIQKLQMRSTTAHTEWLTTQTTENEWAESCRVAVGTCNCCETGSWWQLF